MGHFDVQWCIAGIGILPPKHMSLQCFDPSCWSIDVYRGDLLQHDAY